MAALHVFARTLLSTCRQPYSVIINPWIVTNISVNEVKRRWASFKTSPTYNENIKYTDFEIRTDVEEWLYVERCFKPKYIPLPSRDIENLSSGWKPQQLETGKLVYFIERNKNHLQPVYLHQKNRGMRRLTVVKKIQGDIIALGADLKKYLETTTVSEIGMQILEPSGMIKFRGDHVSLVKKWLTNRGF